MVREIKFRGMTINGKWVFGNLSILKNKIKHVSPGIYISNEYGMPFAYDVRPETVGQFTGLKDKNGKDIYEFDILRYKDIFDNELFLIAVVTWHSTGAVGWSLSNIKTEKLSEFLISNFTQEYEIIGNIHENQELLK